MARPAAGRGRPARRGGASGPPRPRAAGTAGAGPNRHPRRAEGGRRAPDRGRRRLPRRDAARRHAPDPRPVLSRRPLQHGPRRGGPVAGHHRSAVPLHRCRHPVRHDRQPDPEPSRHRAGAVVADARRTRHRAAMADQCRLGGGAADRPPHLRGAGTVAGPRQGYGGVLRQRRPAGGDRRHRGALHGACQPGAACPPGCAADHPEPRRGGRSSARPPHRLRRLRPRLPAPPRSRRAGQAGAERGDTTRPGSLGRIEQGSRIRVANLPPPCSESARDSLSARRRAPARHPRPAGTLS